MRWLNHRKLLLSAFVLLLFCLLLPSHSPAYAMTYQVTEQELATLERNLETLAENSKTKEESLKTLQAQLAIANERLKLLSSSNEAMASSLQRAETSLQEYEKEQKHKEAVKNRQRNTWAAVAIGAVVWACAK